MPACGVFYFYTSYRPSITKPENDASYTASHNKALLVAGDLWRDLKDIGNIACHVTLDGKWYPNELTSEVFNLFFIFLAFIFIKQKKLCKIYN